MNVTAKFFVLGTLLFIQSYANAQTCQGSLGDPIVNFTFGSGSNPGMPLPATTYTFFANDCPTDGSYTIRNNTNSCFGNTWHALPTDHTGDANGYFMLINAAVSSGTFYIDTVRGLCPNTTYEFAAWIMNVLKPSACNGNGSQPNITFSIEKTDGTILQTNSTGNIFATQSPTWNRQPFLFTTTSAVSDVVLRMVNIAPGGCGNDLAIDDITFRPCGPLLTPTITNAGNQTTTEFCKGEIKSYTFNCTVSAGFTNAEYQWQHSFNGSAFTSIAGANTTFLQVQYPSSSPVGIYTYRLLAAEAGNISSLQCRILSASITITIKQSPVAVVSSNSPICQNDTIKLSASGGSIFDWQGPNGFISNVGNPTIANAQFLNQGKYYVKVTDGNGCSVLDSTIVALSPAPSASVSFMDSTICSAEKILLSAGGGVEYKWNPVQFLTTPDQANTFANPLSSIKYIVTVKNAGGCTDTASVNLNVVKKPVVNAGPDQTIIAGKMISLAGSIIGDAASFEWSPNQFINNVNILNPLVNTPSDFQYFLTATAPNNCGIVKDSMQIKIYNGIFIPNAFTPNGDTKNETWNVPALEAYPLHTMAIYNRYGQLVFERKKSFLPWNGMFKGNILPPGAYTYVIDLKNGSPLLKGTLLLLK